MRTHEVLASPNGSLSSPLVWFLLVICGVFLACLTAGLRDTSDETAEFFSANRSLSSVRNAFAMGGDYILVTSLLIPVGGVALTGYDGMAAVAWTITSLCLMVFLAQPVRNTGHFTLGGILESRTPGDSVRIAGGVITLVVSVPLTVVQLVVAGDTTAFVLGLDRPEVVQVSTIFTSLLIVSYAAFGGMRGVSLLAGFKAVALFAIFTGAAVLVARHFNWELDALVTAADTHSGVPDYQAPGLFFGQGSTGTFERISGGLAVLGYAVLPVMLLRMSASRNGQTARRSARYAVLGYTLFSTTMVILGFGAAALVGGEKIIEGNQHGDTALFLLADSLNGGVSGPLFTLIACAVFTVALGSVAGLTLAAAAALVQDVWVQAESRGKSRAVSRVRGARWAVMGFGVVTVVLAVKLHDYNILFLASYAVTLAASTILPALLQSLFWKSCTRRGILWTLYGGLISCTLLQVGSPTVSGAPLALVPGLDFQWFPLRNIAVVTVPLGFLLGWLGSRLDRHTNLASVSSSDVEVRTLIGSYKV